MRARALVFSFALLCVAECGIILSLLRRTPSPSISTANFNPRTYTGAPPILKTHGTPRFNWSTVESADYKIYIANLRNIGCPEETVRDVIIADVDKLFASKNKVFASHRLRQYWEPETREVTSFPVPEESNQRSVEEQKRALLKELLGVDVDAERRKLNGENDARHERLAFLPERKRDAVQAVLDKYAALERQFHEKVLPRRDALTEVDRFELQSIHNQESAELRLILSPAEREIYDLWMSGAAVAARGALATMEAPTEQDFLAIYKARKTLDEQFPAESLDLSEPTVNAKWSEASTAAEQQIRKALGEERYNQYLRGQDVTFQQLLEIVRQYQLPDATAASIYELKQRIETAGKALSLPSANEPDRIAVLDPMRRDADQSVRDLLGETAYQYYRRNGNAEWLQSTTKSKL